MLAKTETRAPARGGGSPEEDGDAPADEWPVPGGRTAALGLALAAQLYRFGVAVRNGGFDLRLIPVRQAAVPVVAVGNLVVGGSGKTPFTRRLVAELVARGARPGILHGGYGADEPALLREWHPALPVVVDRDRVRGAAVAVARGATVLILDDAFQHRRIARDLDILLVPAESWTDRPRLLPRGPWREPLAALNRADHVIVTRRTSPKERAVEVASAIAQRLGGASDRVSRTWLRADTWRAVAAGSDVPAHGAPPADQPVLAVASVARPRAFFMNARDAGAPIDARLVFPDHHEYDERDIARIARTAAGRRIVTTEKDWVKLARQRTAPLAGWVLEQRVEIEDGAARLHAALDAVASRAPVPRDGR